MNERDDEAPFPREPWRRLLEDSTDGPPETTDARIRAAARRDLAPRGHRWWLPASLAASFVLAVMIVHSEFGAIRRAPVTQSDRAGGPAMDARIIDRNEGPESRELGKSPAAPARADRPAPAQAEAEEYGYQDRETGSDEAGVGPRIGGPEHDLKAASEIPDDPGAAGEPSVVMDTPTPAAPPQSAAAAQRNLGEVVVTESRRPAAESAEVTEETREELLATTSIRPPFEKTPETWYAYIEKLRAQGKLEEAERQLARLEKAHPGWLERYLRDRAKR
jgi:hypothetical protein